MKTDFEKSILENRRKKGRPFVAAHRGVSRANIPCNTLAAFQIAVSQGADVIELDITKSRDGEYFVFHPGMEPVFLNCGSLITEMTAKEVKTIPLTGLPRITVCLRFPRRFHSCRERPILMWTNSGRMWSKLPGRSAGRGWKSR